jgi:hypothetical protein
VKNPSQEWVFGGAFGQRWPIASGSANIRIDQDYPIQADLDDSYNRDRRQGRCLARKINFGVFNN